MEVYEDADITTYTTFRVPGAARYFVVVRSAADLHAAYTDPRWQQLPRVILGGGSNSLFAASFAGVVIHPALRGIEVTAEDDTYVYVTAAAGERWDDLVSFAVSRGLGGIENLISIPGSVGAAPVQNIGAYGVELADVFDHLTAYSCTDAAHVTFDRQACAFGYRTSIFKTQLRDHVITDVTLRLTKEPTLQTDYASLKQYFMKHEKVPQTIADVADAVAAIRASKLPAPAVVGNAGSFFASPVVSEAVYRTLKNQYGDVPAYKQEAGYKIPAGWLIERAGYKGIRRGAVGVHPDHALVLVHYGGGTAADVLALAHEIYAHVKDQFSIALTPEVTIIPETAWRRAI